MSRLQPPPLPERSPARALSMAAGIQEIAESLADASLARSGATKAIVSLPDRGRTLVLEVTDGSVSRLRWDIWSDANPAPAPQTHSMPQTGARFAGSEAPPDGVSHHTNLPTLQAIYIPIPHQQRPLGFLRLEGLTDTQTNVDLITKLELLAWQAGNLVRGILIDEERQRLADSYQAAAIALDELEASKRASQEISRTGSWTWDPTNPSYGEWSLEVFKLLHYDPATTNPSFERNVDRVHPDDRDRYLKEAYETVAKGQRLNIEYRYLLPDGSIRHVHALGRRISATLYVGTVSDITERRIAEEAVRKAHAELAGAMRLTTLGDLSASITHELNQPLTALVAHAGAALRWIDGSLPNLARARESLTALMASSSRARDVVASLRALAHKSEPELRLIDFDGALDEIINLMRSELVIQKVMLVMDLGARQACLRGDRVQLQQVILAMMMACVDSLRTTTDRDRTLSILTSTTDNSGVRLKIEDNGNGIDPSMIEARLDPFVSETDAVRIGLLVSRSIVEAHGGTLSIVPRRPNGTIFELELPGAAPSVSV
jgi:signal transduction histidine kinase